MKSASAEGLLLKRAAIYARISKDDGDGRSESVQLQIKKAREFAAANGWSVSEEHIFKDEGISGAEYVNRPGLHQLMASVPKRGKPPFEFLILSEASRLGRDTARNLVYVVDLTEHGVRI